MDAPDAPRHDLDRVRHLARLARLEISPERAAELAPQFASILRQFQSLTELSEPLPEVPCKTENETSPSPACEAAGDWRADEARPGLGREELLSGAPESTEGHFGVPPALEEQG